MSGDGRRGTASRIRSRRPVVLIGVIALVLAGTAGCASRGPAGLPPETTSETGAPSLLAPSDAPTTAPPDYPTPTPPAPTPTPTPVPPTDPDTATIPDDCTYLYSPAMFEYLSVDQELPLNDGTTSTPPFSKVENVAALQEGLPGLVCTWASAGHFGLLTQVNEVSATQATAAEQALRDEGFTCKEQAGGTRCAVKNSGDGETWGETHFLRGNVWVCTFWANFTPSGYTADIVATLWR